MVVVATMLPVELAELGGWAEHTVTLPDGGWTDLLTGRQVDGGSVKIAEMLASLPVALLVAADASAD